MIYVRKFLSRGIILTSAIIIIVSILLFQVCYTERNKEIESLKWLSKSIIIDTFEFNGYINKDKLLKYLGAGDIKEASLSLGRVSKFVSDSNIEAKVYDLSIDKVELSLLGNKAKVYYSMDWQITSPNQKYYKTEKFTKTVLCLKKENGSWVIDVN